MLAVQTLSSERVALNPIFMAPPFGQFFRRKDISPVLGSYTLSARAGRYTQALKTVRPLGQGNWVNRIGLRNPGIDALPMPAHTRSVLSIAAVEPTDWALWAQVLSHNINAQHYAALELNLSCPNVEQVVFDMSLIAKLKQVMPNIIVKMPPKTQALTLMQALIEQGVNTFHLSNTFPTKRGGLSGQRLKRINLRLIERARKTFGHQIRIIAGGGIYSINDAQDYLSLGVEGVSLGTICYQPWRLLPIIGQLTKALPPFIFNE